MIASLCFAAPDLFFRVEPANRKHEQVSSASANTRPTEVGIYWATTVTSRRSKDGSKKKDIETQEE